MRPHHLNVGMQTDEAKRPFQPKTATATAISSSPQQSSRQLLACTPKNMGFLFCPLLHLFCGNAVTTGTLVTEKCSQENGKRDGALHKNSEGYTSSTMARFSIDIDTPPKQRPPPTPPTQVRSPFTSSSAAATSTAGSASSSTTPHRRRRVPESSRRSLRRSQYRSHRENVSLPRLWTCLAPDGRSLLSLSSQRGSNGEQEFLIEWQPLSSLAGLGKSQRNNDDEDLPTELKEARTMFQSPSTPLEMSRKSSSSAAAAVLIPLPDHVQDALRRQAPLELICVDADPSSSSSIRGKFVSQQHRRDLMTPDRMGRGASANIMVLPILCVYTSKDAFLLELAVPSDGSHTNNPMDSNHRSYSTPMSSPPPAPGTPGRVGKVLAVSEPFESQLLEASYSTRIVRIRPAPQFRMGYETLCRSRAMAMLTYDREANRYALTLCHGNSRLSTAQQQGGTSAQPFTTQPLSFGMESLDEQDSITDFCFAQSEGLALFSSMSVLLLQESGRILCASPIVFDGTVVSRESVQKCLTYLDDERSSLDLKSAKAKQYKAAHMYLEAVFGDEMEKTRNTYLTARIQASLMHKEETAVEWPLAIQGPILVPPQDAMDSPAAVSLEPFFAPKLVGIAVGRGGGGVDLALLTPSGLLPRFVYERQEDGFRLNDDLQRLGVVVERIVVENNQESGQTPSSSQPTNTHHNLIPDPAVNTLLHSASAAGVVTISTNIMHVSSQGLCGEKENDPDGAAASAQMEERSTAWSSLNVTTVNDGVVLQGAVVTRDSLLGHVMIARLSNGECTFF